MCRRLGSAVLVAAIAAACGGVVDPSKNQVEPISGTLNLASSSGANVGIHQINITKSGELTISIGTLTPNVPGGTYFAVGIGQLTGALAINNCSPLQVNQFAVAGTAAIGPVPITPGTYCVFLYDEGLFTVPETYSGNVSHP
jgi:hypothetical protein